MHIDHATKENILEAAKTEFSLHGFSGARLAVIAENAQVNKALIHYYFKSKELLYESVWESFFMLDDNTENVPIYFDGASFTIPQKLYLCVYITTILNSKFIDAEIMNIALWELAEGGKFLKKFKDKHFIATHRFFELVIEAGQKEGIFDLKYKDMITLGSAAMNFFYKIEQSKVFKGMTHFNTSNKDSDSDKYRDEEYLDYKVNYIFRMLSPPNKIIPIPEIEPKILEYIDRLLRMDLNRVSVPVARRIMDFLCNDLV